MTPLGNNVLVRDVIEGEKKTQAGIILTDGNKQYKKVKVENKSPDSESKFNEGDTCLSLFGGLEIEKGLWLCNENLLQAVI